MIRNLSYVGFTSPSTTEWRTFGPELLGAQLAPDGPDGAVRLRLDRAPWRVAIHPGDHDDIAYIGWDVGDDLEAAVDRITASGITVDREVGAGERPGGEVVSFCDPFGFRHEFTVPLVDSEPFAPGREMGGFVTGGQGVGHVVLIVPDLEAALGFYTDVVGLRLSDTIESFLSLRFFHCPGHASRHHSLALASVPGMVGIHHLMLEVGAVDDVGRAYDLARERGIALAMDLGRHTNDLMTSFYVRTPSGFEIEYGTGGRLIDDDTWQVRSYNAMSIWGHHPPVSGPLMPGVIHPFAKEEASA